eukprot:1158755-Pelagomonas_calceolata.AAC.6
MSHVVLESCPISMGNGDSWLKRPISPLHNKFNEQGGLVGTLVVYVKSINQDYLSSKGQTQRRTRTYWYLLVDRAEGLTAIAPVEFQARAADVALAAVCHTVSANTPMKPGHGTSMLSSCSFLTGKRGQFDPWINSLTSNTDLLPAPITPIRGGENYTGWAKETLPTSIMEKETHWLKRAVILLQHRGKKRRAGTGPHREPA